MIAASVKPEYKPLDVIQFLLSHGANVHLATSHGLQALHFAAMYGNDAMIHLLLERKAQINVTALNGWQPLHYAADSGHEVTLALLLKQGACVDVIDRMGQTPLHRAVIGNHRSILEHLLHDGANVHQMDNDGLSPLMHALLGRRDILTQLMMNYEPDANMPWTTIQSLVLHFGIETHDSALVHTLIDYAGLFAVNVPSTRGETPLIHALKGERVYWEIVEVLLQHGADPNESDIDGTTPLFYAIDSCSESLVRLLLIHGADISHSKDDGTTPLLHAVRCQEVDMVELFLEMGAELDETTRDNEWTPLRRSAAVSTHPIQQEKYSSSISL
jgi:ankyrin repeat protein